MSGIIHSQFIPNSSYLNSIKERIEAYGISCKIFFQLIVTILNDKMNL